MDSGFVNTSSAPWMHSGSGSATRPPSRLFLPILPEYSKGSRVAYEAVVNRRLFPANQTDWRGRVYNQLSETRFRADIGQPAMDYRQNRGQCSTERVVRFGWGGRAFHVEDGPPDVRTSCHRKRLHRHARPDQVSLRSLSLNSSDGFSSRSTRDILGGRRGR